MTTTPTVATDPFGVNSTARSTLPQAVTLSNGNLLIAYISQAANSRDGFFAHGQQFDKDGNKIGGEIDFVFPEETDTENLDIVALDNGRVAVLVDQDHPTAGNNLDSGTVGIFGVDAAGNSVLISDELHDVAGSGFRNFDFALASLPGDGWMAHSTNETAGANKLRQTSDVQRTDNIEGLGFRAGRDDVLESTTLESGVVVLLHDLDGDENADGAFKVRIIDGQSGNTVRTIFVGDDDHNNFDGAVQALKGGGFVIAWTDEDGRDTDVRFQVFNGFGGVVGSISPLFAGVPGTGNNNSEPSIAALEDGGFVIFYLNEEGAPEVRGQRYSETGDKVGDDFLVAEADASQIDATLMQGGQIAVTYLEDTGSTTTVRAVIIEPDAIAGTDGADDLTGTEEEDVILGLAGNDQIAGNNGDDDIDGGAGDDEITGGRGDDSIDGGAGNDRIFGQQGRDTINGGAGDDYIHGQGGNDVIRGGEGTDILRGGNGADVFVFRSGDDANTVKDFSATDMIDLSGVSAISSFDDLQANHLQQVGADVVIDDEQGTTITLEGVDLNTLDAGDFLF